MKSKFSLPLKVTVALSMLAAISIILGKYLAFGIGEVLRISFENLPVIFAGIAFGAIAGMAVGICADLIGCVLVGYAINPLITVGAALIGLVSGLCYKLFCHIKIGRGASIALSVGASHLIGSVAVKTVGLAVFYSYPVHILMLWRLLNYIIVGIPEALILIALFKNKTLTHQLALMKRSEKGRQKK